MIKGGNVTVFVADFEGTLRFYTDVLGFPLRFRAENFWAEVAAGEGDAALVIGIHPASDAAAAPGTVGAMHIGLMVEGPLPEFMKTLESRGVQFDGPMIEDPGSGNRFANLRDPEGNRLYLWEQQQDAG